MGGSLPLPPFTQRLLDLQAALSLPFSVPIFLPMSDGPQNAAMPDFRQSAHYLPLTVARNETRVRRGFWKKLARVAGRIPFAEEAAAAWFCAMDPETPFRVRATILAALAYFVMPADFIPDVIAGFGFTDDATVLMTAISIVSGHMKEAHRAAARKTLGRSGD